MPKNNLLEKTMREIHKAILESRSLKDAAEKLGIRDETLQRHLGKTTYTNDKGKLQSLTYAIMKKDWPSEQAGAEKWESAYDQPMNTTKIDLTKTTIRKIHKIILESKSLSDASHTLGIERGTLPRYLAKITYMDDKGKLQSLTYETMKKDWPNEQIGADKLKLAYDKPITPTNTDFTQKTMREIHKTVLESTSLLDAINKLGTARITFQKHLAKIIYTDDENKLQPLTYEAMKRNWPNELAGENKWKSAYDRPIQANFAKKSMREIHQAILESTSLTDAAEKLNTESDTLQMHLAKTTYTDNEDKLQFLTYEAMKKDWPSEQAGAEKWKLAYRFPIKTDLTKKLMREIHKVILESTSLKDAAEKLGISDETLQRHLGKTTYTNDQGKLQSLTCEIMKKDWPSEQAGAEKWESAYDQPMNTTKIDLTKKTMREIHKTVLESTSLSDAANKLSTARITFRKHLAKIIYTDDENKLQPLTYEAMKKNWPNELAGENKWKSAYDLPLGFIEEGTVEAMLFNNDDNISSASQTSIEDLAKELQSSLEKNSNNSTSFAEEKDLIEETLFNNNEDFPSVSQTSIEDLAKELQSSLKKNNKEPDPLFNSNQAAESSDEQNSYSLHGLFSTTIQKRHAPSLQKDNRSKKQRSR